MAKRALCIGINNYPGTGSDLSGCVNDAHDWTAALAGRGFTVEQLLDAQATKVAMVEAMTRLVTTASAGDVIVIQYSGHGSWIPDVDGDEPDRRDEVLCPHDIGQNRPLSDDELYDIFAERQRGVRIVFVSDSCHSGSVSRFAPHLPAGEHPRRVRFLPPEAFLPPATVHATGARGARRAAASPPGRHVAMLLAGCQDTEFSYDAWFNGRPNGAFTYAALQVLPQLAADATYRDWYRAIRQALPTAEYPQTPNLYGSFRQKRWQLFA